MSVPNFSLVMIAGYILFMEGSWIDYLEKRFTSTAQSFSMPMPPVGNPLWFLLALTQPDAVRPRNGIQVDHYDGWWVEDDNGKTYISTSAWRFTAAHIPFGHLWSGILQYRFVRRTLWNLGSLWARRLPTITGAPCIAPLGKTPRWQIIVPRVMIAAYLIPMIGLVTQWNLHQVTLNDRAQPLAPTVEGRARGAVLLVGMYQGWGMFAPFPATPSGWITIPGVFEDEREINLLTNSPNSDNMIYWRLVPMVGCVSTTKASVMKTAQRY